MAEIRRSQKKSGLEALPLIGGIVGAAFGGPPGAVAGAGAGSTVGQIAQSKPQTAPLASKGTSGGADPSQVFGMAMQAKQVGEKSPVKGIASPESPIERRMSELQNDRLQQLREGMLALPQMPDEVRRQYARPLLEAYEMETRNRKGIV